MIDLKDVHLGYVVKRYPRYSETFVVREILAHEAAGVAIDIFSLRPPNDTHFQTGIAKVRAPVTYISSEGISGIDFWAAFASAARLIPDLGKKLDFACGQEARDVYQAILLAQQVVEKGIFHLHAPFASVATSVTRLAARFAGITYSCTARAKDIFHETVQHEDLSRKFADAAAVVTISNYHLEYLQKTFGSAASHARRIYNGLNLQDYTYSSPQERHPRILSVGRLVEKKGFADLIQACAILSDRGCKFTCEIIGTGPLMNDLNEQILQSELQSKVRLIGPRPEPQVIDHIRRAAVFALPCIVGTDGDRDGLPNALFEAMALGTPCISTDVAGIPEILQHGHTGLMVPQQNPEALAHALQNLLNDPATRLRLAQAARSLIEKEFDITRNAAKRRELFASAIFSPDFGGIES